MIDIVARPSPNHGARAPDTPIDTLVVHYTGMPTAAAALARLCDPASRVSAHYLIDEAGTVYRLVADGRRAWHAGVSFWRGCDDLNARSLGIELANPGHDHGYRDFPDAQIDALIELARALAARHPIAARNVVAHSDIAPARKQDPGERFPWARLAAAGIGVWPDRAATPARDLAAVLAAIGYGPAGLPAAVLTAAFQRHFRPARVDGAADEETLACAAAVLAAVAAADRAP